jgi:hypothetical protein
MRHHSTTRALLPSRLLSIVAALTASVLLLGACDSSGPSTEGGNVAVDFGTSYSTSGSASAATAKSSHDSLDVVGSNGILEISDVRLIVSEIEMEGDADNAEFESEPRLLDLPLDTADVEPVTAREIPPATYDEFEFEVEDVEVDDADDDEEALADLRTEIRSDFPNWPEGASMVVVSTFTPEGGTPENDTTYFEAEIEVERDLEPALEVTGEGFSRTLTVQLDPTRWFTNSDGTVWNLPERAAGDELIEFEAEFEDGVAEIEVDDDDDEDDDDDDDDSDD